METFDQWWERAGDPRISGLNHVAHIARAAFDAARAQSRNYVADDEAMPERVTFANGRIVSIQDNPDHSGVYLAVGQLPDAK